MTNVRVSLVTYDTDVGHPGVRRLIRSAQKWGWDYHVVTDGRWLGFGRKFKQIAAACRELSASYDYAISVDARDCLVVGPPSAFEPPPQPLTFATERGCWPVGDVRDQYPPCPHPWRFLNSPFTLDLRRCDLLHDELLADHDDDQWHGTKLFLGGVPGVGLDYDCRYVQSFAFCVGEWDDCFEFTADRRVRNKLTGSLPLVMHGNGGTTFDPLTPILD